MRQKCKASLARVPQDALLVTVLLAACLASFGLGYLAGRDSAGQGSGAVLETSPLIASSTGEIVAAKGGMKYYFPSCAGVGRISDANKIWFTSAQAAEAQGYSLAANCKAL